MRREKEKDYLAPFLARLGDKEHLTSEEKARVKEDCLRDAQSRQEVVANIIQAHFERVGVVCYHGNQGAWSVVMATSECGLSVVIIIGE